MTRLIEVTHIGEDYATIKVKGTRGEFQTSRGLGEAILKAYEREEESNRAGFNESHFTKIDNDAYGNPRYYIPAYIFPDTMTEKQRKSAGLVKYRGTRYGAGYVVQSYSLESTCDHINKTIF